MKIIRSGNFQKCIYEDCDQDYVAFGDRVGWRVEGNWLWWNNLTFSVDAPFGHLPIWRVCAVAFRFVKMDSYLSRSPQE